MRLLRWFRPARSGGLRVSRATHRAIQRGDRARAARDWVAAAAAYRDALRRDPGLVHIAVQLGHALIEQGQLDQAEAVYRDATVRAPRDRDPMLHLAHIQNRRKAFADAAASFATLIERDRDDDEALEEAMRATARLSGLDRRAMATRLIEARQIDPLGRDRLMPSDSGRILYFDVSDLVHHLGLGRSLTGIQRVQSEVALQLEAEIAGRMLCMYLEGERSWVALPAAAVAEIITASMAADDARATCRHRWERLVLSVLAQPTISFRPADVIVNLGTSWSTSSYPGAVAAARQTAGIAFVTMIFDLIPLLHPEWCEAGLVKDFSRWFESIVGEVDGFIAISRSTANDLIRVMAPSLAIEPNRVAVVPLCACPAFRDASPALAAAIDITRPYVLLVSTIEPRKGHLTAFAAWSRLIAKHGEAVPDLVCVGRGGWLNRSIYDRLTDDAALARQTTIRSDVDDATLATLYAGCDFALYPSHYEGWGLPITEALCSGKAVVTADNSSLREAGGDLALYFPDDDDAALAAVAEKLILDTAYRQAIEARIRREFKPRTWREIATGIDDEVERMLAASTRITAPTAASRDLANPPLLD